MLKALIDVQARGIFSSMFKSSRGGKKRSVGFKLLVGSFAVVVVLCLLLAFGMYFYQLSGLKDAGFGWLYFSFMGISSFALCFFMGVFTAQKALFEAKDNELLLSMPIPSRLILFSRMLSLYAFTLIIEMLLVLPAGVVWCVRFGASVLGVTLFILAALLLPLLSLCVSSLFGWVLSVVGSRMRSKSAWSLIFSLLLLGGYMYLMLNLNSGIESLVQNAGQTASSIRGAVYPAWALGVGIAEGNIGAFLGFAACCAVPFALVYILLSRFFLTAAAGGRAAVKVKYKEGRQRRNSVSSALLKRELARFKANDMYILNACMGSILGIAAAVAVIVFRDKITGAFSGFEPALFTAAVALTLCFLCATDLISAPSVSLEGKSIWILKVLPVTARQVLAAKVKLHIVVAMPVCVVTSVCVIIAFRFSTLEQIDLLLLPAALTVFCAYLGVCVNLRFPKLDYLNETAVVKQSASVGVTMIGEITATSLPFAVWLIWLGGGVDIGVYLLGTTALYVLGCVIMHLWLGKKGSELFEAL